MLWCIIALLCNIATLYYILRDSTGFDYALRAYELNKASPEVRAYTMTRSSILLAQMYCLKGCYSSAFSLAQESCSEILDFPELASDLYLLYADICYSNDDRQCAESYYKKAINYGHYADLGDRVLVFLRYADFLNACGRYSEAKKQLLEELFLMAVLALCLSAACEKNDEGSVVDTDVKLAIIMSLL